MRYTIIQGDVNNIGTQYNYPPKQNLAESAVEIKHNPTIKARLLSALKAGGTEVLKLALDAIFKNPAVSISVETVKGFIEAE